MTFNRELFVHDPVTRTIPNDGVSKLSPLRTEREWAVLHYELESFVCEGEYERGLQRILDAYLGHLDQGTQPAVWVSGFYGSGKSHLVRVLEHLWADTRFPDGATARGLASLPQTITDSLRELSTRSARIGAVPWSAAGDLGTTSVDQLNLGFLEIVLRAAGLPDKVAPAELRLWLRDEGIEDAVVAALRADGVDENKAISGFHLSEPLARAVLAQRPEMATSPADVHSRFKLQFPDRTSLSVAKTVGLLRRVLRGVGGGTVPPTLIVLDEVQQYINDDGDRAMAVQHIVQAVTSEFEGRVLLVATGQQDLTSTSVLQKLQDRFSVKTHLENQDVDQVVRRVLLAKEPARVGELAATLERAKGEISRELGSARLAHRPADDDVLAADYPLLPSRRRFWEAVLRVADAGGRAGQLRSQLRVVHSANQHAATSPIGTVVGADFLYDEKHSDLNQSGRLLKETQHLIAEQAKHSDDGLLRGRILGLIHLISLLPTGGAADTGIRPTADHLADLLVEDLDQDGGRLRQRVPELLAAMAQEGVLQQHGTEFRLQTAEGREWDQEFVRSRAALAGSAGELAAARDALLRDAVRALVPARVAQGKVKEQRTVVFQTGDTEPNVPGAIPVWLRSEWDGVTRKQFTDLACGAGQDSPTVFVHLRKEHADELRGAVLDLEASREVLETRARPTTEEGREAHAAMQSRHDAARGRTEAEIALLLADATVELAGGAPVTGSTLRDRLEQATTRAVARLYPDFTTADDQRWSTVIKRLSEGNKQPLDALGWSGPQEEHPVVKTVYAQVQGVWVTGRRLSEVFTAPPYGWPLDAVRGAVGTLIAAGLVTAQVNGAPADAKQAMALGSKLGPLQVRRESAVVTTTQELEAKALLRTLGATVTNEPLPEQIGRALDAISRRAQDVSGAAPLPQVPVPAVLAEVRHHSGNEQVLALLAASDATKELGPRLTALEHRLTPRRAALDSARRLAAASVGIAGAEAAIARLRAFEAGRSLLDETDGITPILQELTNAVRTAVVEATDRYEAARAAALAEIEADPAFIALDQARRDELLAGAGLAPRSPVPVADASEVLTAVTDRPPSGWDDAIDSLVAKAARVRTEAARAVAPQAVTVRVPGATVTSAAELDAYLASLRARLEAALAEHGAVVVKPS